MSDVLELLREYVALTGGSLSLREDGLIAFEPSRSDEHRFESDAFLLATDPEGVDLHPEAEVAVLGSRFAEEIIEAIRARGTRVDRGFLPVSTEVPAERRVGLVSLRRGTVVDQEVDTRWIPLGRLHVAASVRTGHHVEDHLTATSFFDLTGGSAVDMDLDVREVRASPDGHTMESPRDLDRVLPVMLEAIEESLLEGVRARSAEAQERLEAELRRLDRYYERLIAEERSGPDGPRSDAIDAYRADHQRRRAEEIARHTASAELRPIQLEVVYGLADRVAITLEDASSQGILKGRRLRFGTGSWILTCPHCRTENSEEWAVCSEGHVVCADCSGGCTICGTTTCARHGGGQCTTDNHAICSSHAATCSSCSKAYCPAHEARCDVARHDMCASCAVVCAACGQPACRTHSIRTRPSDGATSRIVCSDCRRYCRGQKGEPLGKDEVVQCQTCGEDVCGAHRSACAVDREPHCESHLVKTDRTRRTICETHHARCEEEPGLLFATDEIRVCAGCGKKVCEHDSAPCYADDRMYCMDDVVRLPDGAFGCAEHVRYCSIDGRAGRIDEDIIRCPVCSQGACHEHTAECDSCGRAVCANDRDSGACRTCRDLHSTHDPSDDLLHAYARIGEEKWGRPVEWQEARDATHRVVRVSLNKWGRTVVFCRDHRTEEVTHGILHGVIRTVRVR